MVTTDFLGLEIPNEGDSSDNGNPWATKMDTMFTGMDGAHETISGTHLSVSGTDLSGVVDVQGLGSVSLAANGVNTLVINGLGLIEVQDDPSPTLGGNLDANSKKIINVSQLTLMAGGSEASPAVTFTIDAKTGMYQKTSGVLGFSGSAVEVMTISGGGSTPGVGIDGDLVADTIFAGEYVGPEPVASFNLTTKNYVDTISGHLGVHGNLNGLSNDDHPQYLLADGTRPLSADWDNTGRRIRNTGTSEVTPSAPGTPVTGLFWLDTDATGSTVSGSVLPTNIAVTDTVLTVSDVVLLVSAASGTVLVTLPDPTGEAGRNYYIKKTDSTSNIVTVSGVDGELIDTDDKFELKFQDESIQVITAGTDWWIL